MEKESRLDIVFLDCSNYPQVVLVEETDQEQSKAKWEREAMGGTKVFRHLTLTENHSIPSQVLDSLRAFEGISQMERGLEEVIRRAFDVGRQFERTYPDGKGSQMDPDIQAARKTSVSA
jgi:hypothetical protein